jgi:hypothetical protein
MESRRANAHFASLETLSLASPFFFTCIFRCLVLFSMDNMRFPMMEVDDDDSQSTPYDMNFDVMDWRRYFKYLTIDEKPIGRC